MGTISADYMCFLSTTSYVAVAMATTYDISFIAGAAVLSHGGCCICYDEATVAVLWLLSQWLLLVKYI